MPGRVPTFALNFYNPAVAEQLRTGRKTATIRLGDKSAKYRKGMIVTVLCGARYGQRERVFDAVIDKVEVKALSELSPREIEHDNPQIRRTEEMVWFLSQLYNREIGEDDIVTLIRFSRSLSADAIGVRLQPDPVADRRVLLRMLSFDRGGCLRDRRGDREQQHSEEHCCPQQASLPATAHQMPSAGSASTRGS